jgi:hypothetical protein
MIDVIEQSAVPATVTGTTGKTPLGLALIPAGIMGPDGQLRINISYSHNANANNKTLSIEVGGTLVFISVEQAGTPQMSSTLRIRNRASLQSQVINNVSEVSATSQPATVQATATIDFTRDQQLVIYGQLSNAGDNLTLESFCVEYLRAGP